MILHEHREHHPEDGSGPIPLAALWDRRRGEVADAGLEEVANPSVQARVHADIP
jgi:hypothetical protein